MTDTSDRAARANAEIQDVIFQMMHACERASWSASMGALTVVLVHLFERSPRHLGTEAELREFLRTVVTEAAVHEFRNKRRPI